MRMSCYTFKSADGSLGWDEVYCTQRVVGFWDHSAGNILNNGKLCGHQEMRLLKNKKMGEKYVHVTFLEMP